MVKLNSPKFWVPIVIVAGIVIAAGAYFTARQPTGLHLRIGYQPSTHQLAHMTAMEKNWWLEGLRQYGVVEVTDYEFGSGPPEMDAMRAGDLDIAYVGATPPIVAIANKNLKAKIVAGVQIQGSALALRPKLAEAYIGPASLKGKKIATFPLGSIQSIVLRKWLRDNGIDPEGDLEISPMGPGAAVEAIKAEAVDGIFLPHPGPTIVELDNAGVIVENSGSMWENHACCCLLVSDKLIKEHPEIVKEVIRIHIKATIYNKLHREEASEIYERKTGWPTWKALHSLEIWDGRWVVSPYEGLGGTMDYVSTMYENLGVIDKPLSEGELFNMGFYDNVREEILENEIPTMEELLV